MTEFGPNGEVLSGGGQAAYTGGTDQKTERMALGLITASFVASLAVAALGFVLTAGLSFITDLFGISMYGNDFVEGLQMALILSMLNWVLFFITIPAAFLAMLFSIGQMPRRRILNRAAYLRWGAIWGAILVGATTGFFGLTEGFMSGVGALLSGVSIGAIAGLCSAALFLVIVKPKQQYAHATVDVF